MSKSMEIRYLYDLGYSVKDISRELGIRYQFAYNVVRNYLRDKELEHIRAAETSPVPQEPSAKKEPAVRKIEMAEKATPEKQAEKVVQEGRIKRRWNFETKSWEAI